MEGGRMLSSTGNRNAYINLPYQKKLGPVQ